MAGEGAMKDQPGSNSGLGQHDLYDLRLLDPAERNRANRFRYDEVSAVRSVVRS